ncbi:MAG: hypothetical protein OXC91_06595 [Rhodobacteraceae bacterium]|nr:hypothetical protein [Paracoccaceae bacterium]
MPALSSIVNEVQIPHTFRRAGTQPVAQASDIVSSHPADSGGNNDVDAQLGLLLARGGFRGIWNATATYRLFELVSNAGNLYACRVNGHSGGVNPEANPSDWAIVTAFQGNWFSGSNPRGAIVEHNSNLYLAKQAILGSDPAPDDAANVKWSLMGEDNNTATWAVIGNTDIIPWAKSPMPEPPETPGLVPQIQADNSVSWVNITDNFRGDWSASNTYGRADVVFARSNFFRCLTNNHRSGTGPYGDPDNWEPVSIFVGDWEANYYPVGMVVEENNNFWMSIDAVVPSDPAPSHADNTKWLRLSNYTLTEINALATTIIDNQVQGWAQIGTNLLVPHNNIDARIARTDQIPGTEELQDFVAGFIRAGGGIVVDYDDPNGTLTIRTGGNFQQPEQVRDLIGTTLVAGNNVTIDVDDANDTVTINARDSAIDTQRSDESIRDLVAGFVRAGDNITVTHNDAANTLTIAGLPRRTDAEIRNIISSTLRAGTGITFTTGASTTTINGFSGAYSDLTGTPMMPILGPWVSGTTYAANDIVLSDGRLWYWVPRDNDGDPDWTVAPEDYIPVGMGGRWATLSDWHGIYNTGDLYHRGNIVRGPSVGDNPNHDGYSAYLAIQQSLNTALTDRRHWTRIDRPLVREESGSTSSTATTSWRGLTRDGGGINIVVEANMLLGPGEFAIYRSDSGQEEGAIDLRWQRCFDSLPLNTAGSRRAMVTGWASGGSPTLDVFEVSRHSNGSLRIRGGNANETLTIINREW